MLERKRGGGPHEHRPMGVPGADQITPDRDTIVAISTPPGRGGIGVVRLSGPSAEAIGRGVFRPAGKESGDPRVACFGDFVTAAGEAIDEGYRVIFRPPRAFTGEETVELWTHGSPAVLRRLVEVSVSLGARPATPGEFTLRAFLNGRIDVTQAEAIRDLIEARTAFQAKVAHDQLKGRISTAVNELKSRLSELVARVEAAIEFSEEAEAERFTPAGGALAQVRSVRGDIEQLARTFEHGRRVREGSIVALVGSPNVGKSSLFNRLLGEDRAIVTAEPGTTRDRIEETVDLGGIPVVLNDTAGIRAPRDVVEGEAVRRSQGIVADADLLLQVIDWSRPLLDEERDLIERTEESRGLTVINKVDLPCGLGMDQILYLRKRHDAIEVSARTGEGIESLRRRLEELVVQEVVTSREEPFITNLRQRDLLLGGAMALRRAEMALVGRLGDEYAMLDMREGLDRLGEITGEVGIEGIYDRIFSNFCIGK